MPDVSGKLNQQRAEKPWLDHLIRAGQRYQKQHGDYYAAGITYFSVLALFPVLMIAFAVGGFVLAGNTELLGTVRDEIAEAAPGSMGNQLTELVDSAIASRSTVGVIGLLGALYAGLGWIANLREALTAQWEIKHEKANFLITKIQDLGALFGLFLALAASIGLTAVGGGGVARTILRWLNLEDVPGMGVLLRVVSILVALAATWALFTWVIARLPREPVTFKSAARAGLIAAVVFEIFKLVATFYLKIVLNGPAGAVFGPIIGLLVFTYFTSRFLLFATAWAATSRENLAMVPVAPPDPAVINTPVIVHEGPRLAGALAAFGAGALAVVGVSELFRKRG
jgi:membrane protein